MITVLEGYDPRTEQEFDGFIVITKNGEKGYETFEEMPKDIQCVAKSTQIFNFIRVCCKDDAHFREYVKNEITILTQIFNQLTPNQQKKVLPQITQALNLDIEKTIQNHNKRVQWLMEND